MSRSRSAGDPERARRCVRPRPRRAGPDRRPGSETRKNAAAPVRRPAAARSGPVFSPDAVHVPFGTGAARGQECIAGKQVVAVRDGRAERSVRRPRRHASSARAIVSRQGGCANKLIEAYRGGAAGKGEREPVPGGDCRAERGQNESAAARLRSRPGRERSASDTCGTRHSGLQLRPSRSIRRRASSGPSEPAG